MYGSESTNYGFWKSNVGEGITFEYYYPTPTVIEKPYLTIAVLLKPFDAIPSSPIKELLSYRSSNSTERSNELANLWIRTCNETHTYCKRSLAPLETRVLPARLLEIGSRSGPELKPRLILTNSLPRDTKYMTLSHCWGDYQPLTLTSSNSEGFLDSIPWESVPKTFQDTMLIASQIGVKYVWIDSLCIIQDSDEDWQEQAAIMGDIYQNSHCNIAAAVAKDARDGCFVKRPQTAFRSCKIKARWRGRSSQVYFCCSFKGSDETWDGPLHKRAWVLQEMVLAPRALHFAKQIWWKCLELEASETFPYGVPDNKGISNRSGLDVYSVRQNILRAGSEKFQRFELWEKLAFRYSECALSRPKTDKLVAISSIARKLVGNGDDYIAGLWKENLAEQLTWHIDLDQPEMMPPNTGFPSWSWAAVNRRTWIEVPHEYDEGQITITVRILEMHATLQGADPFGNIEPGAFLRLEGPLVKTTIRPYDNGYHHSFEWLLGNSVADVYPDHGKYTEGQTVFCLLIRVGEIRRVDTGIVLERDEAVPGRYRRSGFFRAYDGYKGDKWLQYFNLMRRDSLRSDEYEEALGVDPTLGLPFYRISIV
ncbi:HET-domain-containing protein [Mollisia scopiformis]|uniref:HET-domain-containing protein n=1 Tax=Mollisia scopiformis TaxID=149040 RepID=A0A194WWV6_MOLSC|nr:HET-domain-containing protein [Mollisia scopiformis]KUJ12461.1 HET-domain-containing protein [Mollisia scopiformis]